MCTTPMPEHSIMNDGITPLLQNKTSMVVGFDFGWFGLDAPEKITFRGFTYKRGNLTFIPREYHSEFCSCREYILDKDAHLN